MAAVPAARPAYSPATIAGGSARHSYTTSGDVTSRLAKMRIGWGESNSCEPPRPEFDWRVTLEGGLLPAQNRTVS